ncbi:MAG: PVC-type heme-binding CxxCH protein [Akkermansiaceae bacterium]
MKPLLIILLTAASLFGETRSLFDGKTLNQWEGAPGIWRVEDGAITASIKDGERLRRNEFLYWKGEVADFELSLEYKITGGPTANSGIQIRSTKDASGHAAGYQCDLDDGKLWLGRIYDEHGRALIAERGALTKISTDGKRQSLPFSPPASLQRFAKAGDWNHYLIRAVGNRIEIHINDIHFTTLDDVQVGQADLSGLLGVQLHSGAGPAKIQFRNINLTTFDPQPEVAAPDREPEKPKKAVAGIVPADAPNIGFEKGNFDGWTQTGNVFPKGPIKGDTIVARGRGNSNHDGNFWIGGYEVDKSDLSQGTMTSDPFKVTHPWATYRIGAGPLPETRVEILEAKSGKIIHKASGRGQVEDMVVNVIDLKVHLGKMIRIRVVDEASGGWGHINYDDFRFYKEKPTNLEIAPKPNLSSPLLWHLRENPNQDDNLETVRSMQVPAGFSVSTVAAEPDIVQPINFDFDARGRLWVAESVDYPRKPEPGKGKDRIIILEDTDGDGTFDKRKVFADKLSLISGLAVGYGGVYVGSAPDLIFLSDKDGDDRVDGEPQVLVTGFSTRDTHETPNSFLWGNDGWLYGCHGVFNPSWVGKPGTPKEERVYVESAVWRIHPVTHEFQVYAVGGSNQWGLTYNEHGDLFMTHCRSAWGLGPVTQVFRDGHYWSQANRNHAPFIAAPGGGYSNVEIGENTFFKSIAAYGHGEGGAGAQGSKAIFGGHSHCGTMIYLGDNWPDEYRGNLYTSNLHGSQMNREQLVKRDSAYLSSSYGRDQLYTADHEYLSVALKYGPDGAVYFSDWADKQQCHNNRFEIWNRENGRLYRMQWDATYKPVQVNLDQESNAKLISYCDHKNEWFPHTAQHVLRQRVAAGKDMGDVIPVLKKHVLDPSKSNRYRALVMLHACGGLDKATTRILLKGEDEHLVKQALLFATEGGLQDKEIASDLVALSESTPYPTVRLHLALACQNKLPLEVVKPILANLSMKAEDRDDRFIGKAVWYALSRFVDENPSTALDLASQTPLPSLRRALFWNHAKKDLSEVMDRALKLASDNQAADVVSMTLLLHQKTKKIATPSAWPALKARALKSGNRDIQKHVADLDAKFEGTAVVAKKIPFKGKPIGNARKIKVDAAKGLNYAQELIVVDPGEGLELTFHNKDGIPHNLVLIKPGSLEKVGVASDALVSNPKAAEKHYVPGLPEVMDFIPVLNAGDSFILNMRAPSQPGDYPYVCTFPGHWRVMKGILRVRGKSTTSAVDPKAKKILFLAGADSHGWGAHQHVGGTNILAKGMRDSALPVSVKVINQWPEEAELLAHDALVIYADGWGRHPANGKLTSLKKFMDQGGGLTVIHWATGLGSPDAGNRNKDHSVDPVRRQWRNLVGADFEPWHSVSRFWDASFEKLPKHPVTRGVPPFVIHDECYFHLRCESPECDHVTPLHGALPPLEIIKPGSGMDRGGVSALEEVKKGIDQYCAWGFERPQGGRTFGFTGGHTHWNWGRDELRKLILNGVYWTTGAEVPASGIPSERPSAKEMLAGLKGNPGWTEEGLQIMLDRAGVGELIKWGQYSRGPLPVGPKTQPKPKKELGPGLVIEGESLRVVKAEGRAMAQAMQTFGAGIWSGNSQLWWTAGREGATIVLEFAAPADAAHTLYFAGTKAVDYGIHTFTLNGQAIGKPQDFFQPSGVSHTGQVSLGKVKVKKGKNTLIIKSTGSHPKAQKRYMFGLDFLRLAPAR